MKTYVADFETTTTENESHVWAWAVCEVGNTENITIGTTIDEFMQWCRNNPENVKVFFHNAKFDFQFIFYWLFSNGFEHVEQKHRKTKSFTTLISDKGMFYSAEVIFYLKHKNVKKVTFQDSLKLIPLSVEAIGKAFKFPIQKLEIDYSAHNNLPIGSPLTPEEEEYIKHDVQIVAKAIEYFYSQGLDKMTIGSCAMNEYQKLVSKRLFKKYFPPPTYHDDVKQSYRGGFTWLNPKFAGKVVGNGVVLDVNSLYPACMKNFPLPYGTPIFFKGKYEHDVLYPLYTQMIRCQFELKKGKIPTVQIKRSIFFSGNEYLTSSGDQEVSLCLNSVDLKLFFEQYDVYNLEYISGWKFKATKGLFDDYIDKWSNNKIKAKEEGNHGLYLISKLFLNSLYGKFGTDTRVKSKVPYFDDASQTVKYYDSKMEHREGIYIAVASFITSYGRNITIRSAQKIMDNYNEGKSDIQFIYADTDSLHCLSPDFKLPDLDIDSTRLGAWDYEAKFIKAKYLRQKCYMELLTEDVISPEPEYEQKVTVAGMPKNLHKQVTFKNFKIGSTYTGKLQPKQVKGGVILKEVEFTIKK